jgi:glycosyltransferase involved in cell wall biosynthesis
MGPIHGDPAPINDAVSWFAAHVMPLLHARLGRSATLTLVGANLDGADLPDRAIVPRTSQADPSAALAQARVMVVPREASEGLPINVFEAAAQGLPVVLTPAQALRIGWTHGREVLVAETAQEFAVACSLLHTDQLLWEGLRATACARVAADCSGFDAVIRDVLARAVGRRR